VTSIRDIWAVGDDHCGPGCGDEYVAHWDGTRWQTVPSPTAPCTGDDNLSGVSALAANSVWIVGNDQCDQLVEHWDGLHLRLVQLPKQLRGNFIGAADVDAPSATNVWAVGHGIERWNGTRWTLLPMSGLQQPDSLSGVAVPSPTTAWVIGIPTHAYTTGFIAHYVR
jgi:hypothetical protein